MLVALPTCSTLPDWEVDDAPFHAALASLGITVARPIWDDPHVDWKQFHSCLIRTTWDYQEKREQFLKWARAVSQSTRLFNPFDIVRWNTDKRYLRDLAARGVPVAPTIWFEPGDTVDLQRTLHERGWNKGFLKPAIGATARETLRFDTSADGVARASAHLTRMLQGEPMMLQPYLSSVETEGELSAIFFDGTFSHAVCKVPVPGDYRVQDDFGASDEPAALTDSELDLARQCLDAVETPDGAPLLYARADFLRDANGSLLLNELELVEPSLFFRHAPSAADTLAKALRARMA